MSLGIKKNLSVHDIVFPAMLQVCPGQIIKILSGLQYRHSLVIQVQKILQAIELVRLSNRIDVGIGQVNAVALCQ